MKTDTKTLAIVGGGAAGLAAAIAAGEKVRAAGVDVEVVVFERDDRVGRSILATGNGRCNFSNSQIDASRYHNSDFVSAVLQDDLGKGDADSVHCFFGDHGLVWREESDGRQYPQANKASVVVDVLRASAAAVGVREECEREVIEVKLPQGEGRPFVLRMSDGVFERVDAVVVTCGGRAAASLELAGMRLTKTKPVLGPLRCSDKDAKLTRELDNIRVRCSVSLARGQGGHREVVAFERGELMFRKYGVSGICVYDLSRYALPGDELLINFLPEFDVENAAEVEAFLASRLEALRSLFGPKVSYECMLRGLLLPRVYEALLKRAGIGVDDLVDSDAIYGLVTLLTQFPLQVKGAGDAEQCQVRRGGFDVAEFDPANMMARKIPGLFAAGEILDIDGPCGGYNLHWAWASGLIAGESAAGWLGVNRGGNR